MLSWWIGANVEFTRNTRWGSGNTNNFTMNENNIYSMRGLNMSMSSADSANINAYFIQLNRNTIYCTPAMKYISDLAHQGTNLLTGVSPRGFYVYPYAGAIYGLQIHSNHIQSSTQLGYGALLGTSGYNRNRINRMSYQLNYTTSFKYGVYFYKAADNVSRSQLSTSRMWSNAFFSQPSNGNWVYNGSLFHAHNSNYYFNNAEF